MSPPDPARPEIEPTVGTLRVAGGARQGDAAPWAASLTPPPRAVRGRESQRLFLLLDLSGPATPHLYRELREATAQAYWSTAGSITAALRQAAVAANRHLFEFNLHAAPSDRSYGGLACAVLQGEDLFVLRAGPVQACVLHRGQLAGLSGDEPPPQLGVGALPDVRLDHAFVAVGDTLLLASSALAQETGEAALARLLPRAEVAEVLAGLEQLGSGSDFVALVARLAPPSAAPRAPPPAPPEAKQPKMQPRVRVLRRRKRAVERPAEKRPAPAPAEPREPPPRLRKPRQRPKRVRRAGPGLGTRLKGRAKAIGRGFAAAGAWLSSGTITLFRRMLPGPERDARRRARPPRPAPKENRAVMMSVAIGIPVLLAIVVAVTYYGVPGREQRFGSLVRQANKEVGLAQAAQNTPEEARVHWQAAQDYARRAVKERPGDPEAASLLAQAQDALDTLDGIIELAPVQLAEFGRGDALRQVVVHGDKAFVLDPGAGWVEELTLSPTGDGVAEKRYLIHEEQEIGSGVVGKLVDLVWAGPGGERQTSSLVVFEEGGALVSYDPAWGGEDGGLQLTRSLLGTPPAGAARAVDSFEGNLYVLDTGEEQVWRYKPRGDTYPDQPDRYFVTSPSKSLATALDIAIDGHIYILYIDGTILKFLRGEPQPFEVGGVPAGIGEAVALALDSAGGSGMVYVADRGGEQGVGRVIVLEPDGTFHAQFRAEDVLGELESLVVNEAAGRLYVFSGGRLFAAALP